MVPTVGTTTTAGMRRSAAVAVEVAAVAAAAAFPQQLSTTISTSNAVYPIGLQAQAQARLVSSCAVSSSAVFFRCPQPRTSVSPLSVGPPPSVLAELQNKKRSNTVTIRARAGVWRDGVILMRYGIEVCVRELVG